MKKEKPTRNIRLTRGKLAIVDHEDYGYLNKFKWKCSTEGYAVTNFQINTNKRKTVGMQRLVLNPFTELVVDHINNDKLDNRKENLRVCLPHGNTMNRSKSGNGKSSQYKGVGFYKRTGEWQARIGFKGKLIHLGMFKTPEEASKIYVKAAKRYFGKYAWKKFRSAQ